MPDASTLELNQHYGANRLLERIREALLSAALDPEQLTLDAIAPIDQLHIGGRKASLALAAKTTLTPGMHVLDVGCGTGGSARLLAAEFNVEVTGIDITRAFCEAARMLNRATGLDPQIKIDCGDATRLPYADNSFDLIWSQHTCMNIPDKPRLYREFMRVLKPGGQLALHEIVQGPSPGPLHYPVPWATHAGISHLDSAAKLTQQLQQSGFTQVMLEDVSEVALNWRQKHTERETCSPAAPLSPQVIFGPVFLQMGRNLMRNLQEGKIAVLEGVFSKPKTSAAHEQPTA